VRSQSDPASRWRLRFREPPPRSNRVSVTAVRRSQTHRMPRASLPWTTSWSTDKPIHQGRHTVPPEGGWPMSHSRNRRHLPEVLCLTAESGASIVDTLALPAGAFRSQGFTPSQRLDPDTPSWLYFKPTSTQRLHGPSELFPPRAAAVSLDTRCSPAIGRSRTRAGRADRIYGARSIHLACQTDPLDTPPETLASELCSDRASDTLRDG
jgi:hypothetical protein